jgi:hypothetical protein
VGEKRYYAKDHLGSVRDVLGQTGNKLVSYDYGPCGNLISNCSSKPTQTYLNQNKSD